MFQEHHSLSPEYYKALKLLVVCGQVMMVEEGRPAYATQ